MRRNSRIHIGRSDSVVPAAADVKLFASIERLATIANKGWKNVIARSTNLVIGSVARETESGSE